MNTKTRAVLVLATSVASVVAGAGLALANSSGGVTLTADSTHYVGTYRYSCALSGLPSWQTGVCTTGTLHTWNGDSAHLNMKDEGYGWTRIAHANSNSSVNVNGGVYDGAARYVTLMSLQLCHEHTYSADKCVQQAYNK